MQELNSLPLQESQKVKLYNPNQYLVIGFFVSVIPIFYMSIANSRQLKNGDLIRATVLKFLAGYIALMGIFYGLTIWSTLALFESLNKKTVLGDFPQFFLNNGSLVFTGLNLLLLIFLITFVNKNELPEYKELERAGIVKNRSEFVPLILGLIFTLFSAFYASSLARDFVMKGIEKSYISQLQTARVDSQVSNNKQVQNVANVLDITSKAEERPDICSFLGWEKVAQITGAPVVKADSSDKERCFYENSDGKYVVISGTDNYTDIEEQRKGTIKNYNFSKVEFVITPYDQIQKGAFMLKAAGLEIMYFTLNENVYFIAPNLKFMSGKTDLSVALVSQILGVPYENSTSANKVKVKTVTK